MKIKSMIVLGFFMASTGLAIAQSCKPGEKWVCVRQGNEVVCSCQWRF